MMGIGERRGMLHYFMSAHAPAMVAFQRADGKPAETRAQIIHSEVMPLNRPDFAHLVDFVPGLTPNHIAFAFDFGGAGGEAEIRLTFPRMHDAERG